MKKYALLFLCAGLLLCGPEAAANGIGLRGGMNFTSVPSLKQFNLNGFELEALPDSYTGFHFGFVGHFSLNGIFLQPELLYVESGQEMVLNTDNLETQQDYFTHRFSHLALPLVGGFRFGPIRVGLGPVLSVLLDAPRYGGIQQMELHYQDLMLGYHLLAGLKVGNILLDFKYQGSLTRFGDHIRLGDREIEFDTRPSQYIFSVGLLIL